MARFKLKLGLALAAGLALAQAAWASDQGKAAPLATRFVDALQQQRFQDAAAMFAPANSQDSADTAVRLKRVGERIGGYATMRNVPALPEGASVKLDIRAGHQLSARPQTFYQVAYKATAADGKPVFYELALDSAAEPRRILSFAVHLPSADAPSAARAAQVVRELAP